MTVIARRRRSAVTLGAPSLIMRVCAWGVLTSTFVFSGIFLSAPPNDASNILNLMFGLIPVIIVCYLAATVSIRVRSSGQMTVTNLLTRSTFPISALATVEVLDGLVLTLTGGQTLRSLAYADSLMGEIRTTRAAAPQNRVLKITYCYTATVARENLATSFRLRDSIRHDC